MTSTSERPAAGPRCHTLSENVSRGGGPASQEPSGTAANGRGPGGRFAAGNKAACGNPFARRMARLRSALLDAVTEGDIRELGRSLLQQAKGGDVAAAKVLLAYLVGKPAEPNDPDRLDREELELLKAWPSLAGAYVLIEELRAVHGLGGRAKARVDPAEVLHVFRGLVAGAEELRDRLARRPAD